MQKAPSPITIMGSKVNQARLLKGMFKPSATCLAKVPLEVRKGRRFSPTRMTKASHKPGLA
jgi:hypothetical protein